MRGITEKRLRELLKGVRANIDRQHNVYERNRLESIVDGLRIAINECQELNQWHPIETSPKDRKIWLFDGEIFTGQWWLSDWTDWQDHERIVKPTHWMELPEPPK